MTDNLPPLPELPPHEVEEWSESYITLRGEGWKKETVEKYAVDYALAALEADRAAVPAGWVPDVDELAQFIRRIDGNHQMGAGLLAQNICDWLSAAPQPVAQPRECTTPRACEYEGCRGACTQAKPERAAQPVPEAMKTVIAAMKSDPEYAWSWHCNVAMAFMDAGGDRYTANQGAARFMRLLASVEPAHELPSEHPPNLLSWAVDRWLAEVSNRPLVNKNRRTLDDTWRQVIRFAGGDPDELLGPSHDVLAAASPKPLTTTKTKRLRNAIRRP